MALNIWTQPSGYSFGTFPEQVSVNLPLPLIPSVAFNGVPPPSYDGTGHNPTVPLRNSAGSAFARYPVNSYTDGLHAMRTDLANARTVSNLVVWDQVNEGETADPTGYSGFMYAWGQFITHEIAFERVGNQNIDVIVPPGDTKLTPGSHIPVNRLLLVPGTGQNGVVANFINDTTGWIDGTVIYGLVYPPGVTQGTTVFQNPVNLREGGETATTGKLLTSSGGLYGPIDPSTGMFIFGDPRGTENPDLTSIQTLMIREHNWHVDRLRAANPSWTGEQLYQRARNIVIAEEQVITYKEWLPKIIGNDAISAYTGFKPEVDATIKIEVDVAALRFGHSIVSGAQDRVDEAGNITESLTLGQAFFLTPAQYERNGGANGFLRKLASDICNKLDVYIIEDLRNLLNDPPAAMDLAATNIQRGRDAGIPSLNQMRVALGFSAYTSFSQITSDATIANALHSAYVNINDIDLWVGGLAEDRYPGAMVGPTFRAIIADQMSRLRDGDQSWYQNQPWSPSDLEWINNTTLSDVILRNTDTVHMQTDAFVAVERADLISGAVPSIVARSPSTSPPPLSDTAGITFTVISGSLPPGLILQGSTIIGSPYITQGTPTYNFCIRASNGIDFSDRTFTIQVDGANPPEFVTPAGELPVGPRQQLYALDGTYVDYQIEAFDLNTSIGGSLKYFIATGDGSLPPGLTLSNDGVISGYIKPQEILTPAAGTGEFDQADFDIGAYDFALIPTDGFDSYQFDDVFFDYNLPSVLPKSLNANYQFRVTATDGINYAQRIFNIFVVGDDQFRADSTSTNGFSDGFTADSTFLRTPVWLSNTSLGIFRANNYLTVPVLLYDNTDIIFRLETTNCEVYAVSKQILISDNALNSYFVTVTNLSSVPVIGQYFTLDNYLNGATSQTYQISAVNQVTAPITGTLTNGSKIITGINYTFINELTIGATIDGGGIPVNSTIVQIAVNSNVSPNTITVTMNNNATVSTTASINVGIAGYYRLTITTPLAIAIPNFTAFYIGSLSQLPKGTQFDIETGEIYGRVPYQPAITETYAFTITATRFSANIVDQVINHKTFNITILGSINRQITWTSPSNLGTIPANYVSTLRVSATTNIPNDTLLYTLTGGSLPPGLTLTLDGEIVGIPNQYYNSTTGQLGLTTFDGGLTTFDFKETTSDLTYNFTVTVSDQYEYSALPQTFTITLSAPNSVPYSNITCQPFLAPAQRSVWKAFINNPTIFIPSDIYRINDPNFGIQSNLNMLVYAGIQTEVAGAYVGAIGLGFKRKQFKFGSLKTAIATDPITNETVYEVVYVQMIDPRESNGNHLPLNFKTTSLEPNVITVDESIINAKPLYNITVDSKGYLVSNPNTDEYYPNSITNWQTRLSGVGLTERNYLPLWMRSIPLGQKAQLGYVLCVPLCFCKPGTSNDILLNIEHSGFNFNTIDYTVDRFIISAVTGYTSDKYLVFRNDRITV